MGGESKSSISFEKGVAEASYNPDDIAAVFSGRIETRSVTVSGRFTDPFHESNNK